MDRRTFFGTLTGGLLAAPLVGEAQSTERVYQVGILTLGSAGLRPHLVAAIRSEVAQPESRRGPQPRPQVLRRRCQARLQALATGLVNAKPDIIVTTSARETIATKRATASIPTVFTLVHDPVRDGVVTNLAHPDANVTGLTTLVPGFYGK